MRLKNLEGIQIDSIPEKLINNKPKEDLMITFSDYLQYFDDIDFTPITVPEYRKMLRIFNKLIKEYTKEVRTKQLEQNKKKRILAEYNQQLLQEDKPVYRDYQVIENDGLVKTYKLLVDSATKFREDQLLTAFLSSGITDFTREDLCDFANKILTNYVPNSIVRIGVCNRSFVTKPSVQSEAISVHGEIVHRTKTISGKFLKNPSLSDIVNYFEIIIDERIKHFTNYRNEIDEQYFPDTLFYIIIDDGVYCGEIMDQMQYNSKNFMVINTRVSRYCVIYAILGSYLFNTQNFKSILDFYDLLDKTVKEYIKKYKLKSDYNEQEIRYDLCKLLNLNIKIYRGSIKNYVCFYKDSPDTPEDVRILLLEEDRHAVSLVSYDKYMNLISDSNKIPKDERYYGCVKYQSLISSLPLDDLNQVLLKPIDPHETYYSYKNSVMRPMSIPRLTKKIGVIDIETLVKPNSEIQPYLLILCDLDKTNRKVFTGFDCVSEFVKFIADKDMILYAHNGSKFDFVFIVKEISKYYSGVDLWAKSCDGYPRCIVKNTRIINFNFNKVLFKDSYMLLPKSLAELTGQKMEFDHTKVNENNYVDYLEEAITYCTNDVMILADALDKYSNFIPHEFLKEGFTSKDYFFSAITITQLSKTIFYNLKEVLYSLNTFDDRELRPYYFGGKTLVNYRGVLESKENVVINSNHEIVGNGKIYYIDLNSIYPNECINGLFPHGSCKHISVASNEDILNKGERYLTSFVHCYVKGTKEMLEKDIPPFLVYKENNKQTNCYINEPKKMILYYPCYLEALDCGYEIKPYKVTKFSRNENHFKKFFNKFFDLRSKETNKECKYFLKILMNSFTGSLGQKTENVKSYKFSIDLFNNFLNYIAEESFAVNGEIMTKQHTHVNGERTNVSLISAITSYARLRMHRMFRKIIQTGGVLLYSDTDSIIYIGKHPIDHGLPFGDKIGEFKIEAVITECCIANVKCYGYKTEDEEKVILKGYEKKLSYIEFKDHVLNDSDLKEIINSRLNITLKSGSILSKPITKNYKLDLTKGKADLNTFVNFQALDEITVAS